MIAKLTTEQKTKISNQVSYQAYRLKRKFPYIEREEIESELQFFMYKRAYKFKPEKKTSYYTYLIFLIHCGAKKYRDKQNKMRLNEFSLDQFVDQTEQNQSIKKEILKKLIYKENYLKKIEEYELQKEMKKFGEETQKVYELINSNRNIKEISESLDLSRFKIDNILQKIKKVLREYYG